MLRIESEGFIPVPSRRLFAAVARDSKGIVEMMGKRQDGSVAPRASGARRRDVAAPRTGLALAMFLAAVVPSGAVAKPAFVPDGGRIEIGPGWRAEPELRSSSFGGAGRFSWHADERWFVGIEIGGWVGSIDPERVGLDPTSELRILVGDLRVAVGAHLLTLGPGWVYGVGGGGYHVVGLTEDESYREGATQGLFLGAGFMAPLTERVGLFMENRWTFFARLEAQVGQEIRTVDVGGNLLWAGLVVFFPPERRPGDL